MNQPRDTWSGRTGFILATIGSAVGLGSIWKFPYEVGSNGGSAFLLFYLAGLVIIVAPLMFAEFAIGRRGGSDATRSMEKVAADCGAGRGWALVGLLGVITGVLVLSFYSVIGGWTIAYAVETALSGLAGTDAQAVQGRYQALLASPSRLIACHAIFMALTAVVVSRGIGGGIEAAVKVLMPVLLALMVALTAYSVVEGDAAATFRFLFSLDTSYLNARTALDALGLGFFSIGVGFALMITYAAYAGHELDLKQVAIASIVADTAISFLAGFAVFPIVFAHGLNPASGPGLVFVTLPLAFAGMPFGTIAAVAFYVLLFIAALASAISLLELAVALLVRRWSWRRVTASVMVAAACFVLGLATVFSFNLWAGWFPLGGLSGFRAATVFDLLDYFTSNVMLPVCGFFLSVFVGWVLPANLLNDELKLSNLGARLLRATLRYVVPAGIAMAALGPLIR
jgi:neurotransmitter:Na+ symporter, NSS family